MTDMNADDAAAIAGGLSAGDTRPTTITAKDFVEQGYAAKSAAGECIVYYSDLEVAEVNQNNESWGIFCGKDGTGVAFTFSYAPEFTVCWLEATAAPASNGGGDDVDWQARALKAEAERDAAIKDALVARILEEAKIEATMPMYKEYRESVDNQPVSGFSFLGFKHWLASSLSWEMEKTNFLMKKREALEAELAAANSALAAERQRVAVCERELKADQKARACYFTSLLRIRDYNNDHHDYDALAGLEHVQAIASKALEQAAAAALDGEKAG